MIYTDISIKDINNEKSISEDVISNLPVTDASNDLDFFDIDIYGVNYYSFEYFPEELETVPF